MVLAFALVKGPKWIVTLKTNQCPACELDAAVTLRSVALCESSHVWLGL